MRDLPTRELGVDVERGFEPKYVTIKGKTKTLAELKKAAKGAQPSTWPPTRTGKARPSPGTSPTSSTPCVPTHRILFHEITKEAIQEALRQPGKIDDRKVDAQQARRILDRLVGYKASPILWHSIKTGLSAGRVQTVALRLIVEREREIRAFKPQEYWTIEALCAKDGQTFEAALHKVAGHKPQLQTEADARAVVDAVRPRPFIVSKVEKRNRKKNPAAPVHHQHAAAGGRQEAGLLLPPHHARGAGSVRRQGCRRGWAGGSHHLHADRLTRGLRHGHHLGPRLHQEELRQAVPAGLTQRL